MNPMVMMMVLPLLLITVLPKMMGDPETQREMQEMQKNMANTQNQVSSTQLCNKLDYANDIKFYFGPSNCLINHSYQILQMPEVSEVFANLFGGGGPSIQEKSKKKPKLQKR